MAYINEFVLQGEERTFDLGYGRKKTPGIWTIDKEKGYIFFKDYTEIDEPVNQHFVFIYKEKVITMVLDGSEFADHHTKIWKLKGITIPNDLDKTEVLEELKKAISDYGCHGMPYNPRFGDMNGKVTIVFKGATLVLKGETVVETLILKGEND